MAAKRSAPLIKATEDDAPVTEESSIILAVRTRHPAYVMTQNRTNKGLPMLSLIEMGSSRSVASDLTAGRVRTNAAHSDRPAQTVTAPGISNTPMSMFCPSRKNTEKKSEPPNTVSVAEPAKIGITRKKSEKNKAKRSAISKAGTASIKHSRTVRDNAITKAAIFKMPAALRTRKRLSRVAQRKPAAATGIREYMSAPSTNGKTLQRRSTEDQDMYRAIDKPFSRIYLAGATRLPSNICQTPLAQWHPATPDYKTQFIIAPGVCKGKNK